MANSEQITKPGYHVVCALMADEAGRWLCFRKGKTRFGYTSFKWEFPGGKIDAGETPRQALSRELAEELSLDVEVGEHLMTVSHQYPDFSIVLEAFVCKCTGGTLTLTEHVEARYLGADEILELDWCAADRPIAERLRNIAVNHSDFKKK